MWTVYEHPADAPGAYVARRWELVAGQPPRATGDTVTGVTLDVVRWPLERMGLFRIERAPEDDPCIVETWL